MRFLRALAFLSLASIAAAAPRFPAPRGYVNDFAGVMEPYAASELDSELSRFDKERGFQVAVAVMQDIQGADAEAYANALYKEWGIGRKGSDRGVLILVSVGDRKARIEAGYGLEPVLPDALCGRILRDTMVPFFKAGRWSEGVVAGARAVEGVLSGKAESAPQSGPKEETWGQLALGVAVCLFLLLFLFAPRIFPGFVRRRGWGSGGWGGGWSGGGSGWGGGGFSGGGGFGGFGGGCSGGGGASASW
jgi:uncharacterized protein